MQKSSAHEVIAHLGQCGDAEGSEPGLVRQDVLPCNFPDLEMARVELLYLVAGNGEWRTRHLRLAIFECDQQHRRSRVGERGNMAGIGRAQLRRPRYERGAIVHSGDLAEERWRQLEKIPAEQLHVLGFVDVEVALHPPPGRDAVLHAESLESRRGQLDAGDEVSLIAQPEQIEALAAQGHENPASRFEIQQGPMTREAPIDGGLVEADLAVAPTVLPELRFHRSSLWVLAFFGLGARLVGNLVLFRDPRPQVDQPAAIAAERPIGRGFRPLDRPAAGGAFNRRGHERRPIRSSRSAGTARPFPCGPADWWRRAIE